MNYEASLDRAMDATDSRANDDKRLRFPDPVGETDGAFTRLTNLGDIAEALSRDPEHLHSAIQRQFATNGQFDGQRARYNGSFTVADFDTAIREYADEFVICSECGLPDTVLRTEDGVQMLRCEACGAFRPVQKRTSSRSRNTPTLEEGKTYEFEITGTGRKGDGVAEVGKYTVFVSGAQEGQTVRASVYNISGSLAFARPV
ncbi:translation initiation factor IF-2 subunit beta [Haloprofundus salilacus]|uniref:translation initiation factor IF-2 subunit beta n=1 Tax=Haloprofundus salilacus TaxID=2876190 RepID=UPI001CC8F4EF|nr:translation initiation factor IF-2 subunit beta [Haloprofundus salilacus]